MRSRIIALWTFILAMEAVILGGCGEVQSGQSEPGTAGAVGTEIGDISEDAAEPSASQLKDEAMESSAGQPGDGGMESAADWSEDSSVESSESEAEQTSSGQTIFNIPTLPAAGRKLSDFVPEGWELIDSVELDFNEDGIADYVGVQEKAPDEGYYYPPCFRILFGIVSDGSGQYRLDFQDENLIRARNEGGVYGDPYEPLTAEGTSFSTHAYGGSAERWSEAYTYTYRKGTWYLTQSEVYDGYGEYITYYARNDWESGISTQMRRSSEFSDMELRWAEYEDIEDWEEDEEYDLTYEMRLGEPFTLYQAGKRWWLAPNRVTDYEVREIVLAEGIELSQEMIRMPEKAYLNDYCDEDCVLYTFSDKKQDDKWKHYLAMYRWQDKSLTVLAEGEGYFEVPELYGGRIYYSEEVIKHVSYKAVERDENCIKEEDCVIGVRLNRMKPDGTERETIFEYLYPGTDQQLLLQKPPYMGLITDISGGEIVVEVYIGSGEPHPVYRMDADGGKLRQIGQIPKE